VTYSAHRPEQEASVSLKPDPSFYPSPASAIEGPREELAYVVTLNTGTNGGRRPDALTVVDLQEGSSTYGTTIGRLDMPNVGDELHHFGWNACSSALCPWAPHPHVERRYLMVPGLRSSRIHVVDVKDDPVHPKLVKVVEADDLARRTGYSRPHTVHCGPDGLYVSALGAPDGGGPGGVLLLDHDSYDTLGRWEIDRGPQELSYDVWWNIGYDTLLTSEWGTPDMVEEGVNPELLLAGRYGHHLHAWDLRRRRHQQAIDLGPEQQMVLELRPAHDPTRPYGFVGVVVSTADLSASVWLWDRVNGEVTAEKVIEIPAEPAETEQLPPALQPFGAVPPLVTDIALSVDDRTLYVSCWGTGELKRFDVTDPRHPRETGSVRLGGIVRRAPHPAAGPVNGGPQMVEVSRDGRRVYLTNSLYASWDAQFYPDGIDGWMVRIDSEPDGGAFEVDPRFYLPYDGERPHQIRLQGGDASSDSYCFPS
jgi:selenium-binding protein 1